MHHSLLPPRPTTPFGHLHMTTLKVPSTSLGASSPMDFTTLKSPRHPQGFVTSLPSRMMVELRTLSASSMACQPEPCKDLWVKPDAQLWGVAVRNSFPRRLQGP